VIKRYISTPNSISMCLVQEYFLSRGFAWIDGTREVVKTLPISGKNTVIVINFADNLISFADKEYVGYCKYGELNKPELTEEIKAKTLKVPKRKIYILEKQ